MIVSQHSLRVGQLGAESDIVGHFGRAIGPQMNPLSIPLRFSVAESSDAGFECEVAAIENRGNRSTPLADCIFQFRRRRLENTNRFTAVLVVPTGIGAEIGGHAGDAGPVAALLASICDTVITHPNVVNASDINEIPSNALYVEGSAISRLIMGTIGLQPVRANRVLVIIDCHEEESFVNAAVNSVSAARATYGFDCPRVVILDPPLSLTAGYTRAGNAAGKVEGLDRVCRVLDTYRGEYDAVAISSVIGVPPSSHRDYFQSDGQMVNPWGGVEAILTHAVTALYDIPSAHAPMLESEEIADEDPGIVDPRMAAEAVSVAFLQCILKGLQKSPKIISDPDLVDAAGVLSARDISCLVIPSGCLGLPTLAALQQGIPVIAVRENRNIARNELSQLPWNQGQFFEVDNYWEATGVIAALKAGISPASTRRPLQGTIVSRVGMREAPGVTQLFGETVT